MILVIDPGNEKSAYIFFDKTKLALIEFGITDNQKLVAMIKERVDYNKLVVEYPRPRGQPMYYQLVDTIFWIGRFVEAAGCDWQPIDRKDVKMHLTGSTRSTDSNIRAALIERYFEKDIGRYAPGDKSRLKRIPDELRGISKDLWAALAVAVYYSDTENTLSNILT